MDRLSERTVQRGFVDVGGNWNDPSLMTRTLMVIEIWKSNSVWIRRTMEEKRVLVRQLAETLRKEDPLTRETNSGPFLLEKVDHHLLIWCSSRQAELQKAYENIGLCRFFEPITYVTARPDLSAQDLVRILST